MPSLTPSSIGHGRRAGAGREGVAVERTVQMGLAVVGEPAAMPVEQQGRIVDAAVLAQLRVAVEQGHTGLAGDLGGPGGGRPVDRLGQAAHRRRRRWRSRSGTSRGRRAGRRPAPRLHAPAWPAARDWRRRQRSRRAPGTPRSASPPSMRPWFLIVLRRFVAHPRRKGKARRIAPAGLVVKSVAAISSAVRRRRRRGRLGHDRRRLLLVDGGERVRQALEGELAAPRRPRPPARW